MLRSGYVNQTAIIAFGCNLADSKWPAELAKLADAPVISGHGFTALTMSADGKEISIIARTGYNPDTHQGVGGESTFTLVGPNGQTSAPIQSIKFNAETGKATVKYAPKTGSRLPIRETACVDKTKCGK